MDYLKKFVKEYCGNTASQDDFNSEDCKMLEIWNKKLVSSNKINDEELKTVFCDKYPITSMYICNKIKLSDDIIDFIMDNVNDCKIKVALLMQELSLTQFEKLAKKISFVEINHAVNNTHMQALLNPICIDYIAKEVFRTTNELLDINLKKNFYSAISLTKNKTLVETFINNTELLNEQKLAAIVNNPNVSLETRLQAFNMGCDFSLLDLDKQLPNVILTDVYRSLADAHTEYHSLYTNFENDLNFQILINNPHLPIDCQIDYIMRWIGNRAQDHILLKLLASTTQPLVLEQATKLVSKCKDVAYHNKCMPKKYLEQYFGKIYKQAVVDIKKEGTIKKVHLEKIIELINRVSLSELETIKLFNLKDSYVNMNLLKRNITDDTKIDKNTLKEFVTCDDYWCKYYATLSYTVHYPPKGITYSQSEKHKLVGISEYLQFEANNDYTNPYRLSNIFCGIDITNDNKTNTLRNYEVILGKRKELYQFLIDTIEKVETKSTMKMGTPLVNFKEIIEKQQKLQDYQYDKNIKQDKEILKSELREIAGRYSQTIDTPKYVYDLSNPITAMNFYDSLSGFTEKIETNYKLIKEIEKEEKKTEMEK